MFQRVLWQLLWLQSHRAGWAHLPLPRFATSGVPAPLRPGPAVNRTGVQVGQIWVSDTATSWAKSQLHSHKFNPVREAGPHLSGAGTPEIATPKAKPSQAYSTGSAGAATVGWVPGRTPSPISPPLRDRIRLKPSQGLYPQTIYWVTTSHKHLQMGPEPLLFTFNCFFHECS